MFVACSTLCFTRHSLDNALKLMAELEFAKFEAAIHEQGPHLRPSEVAADLAQAAHRLRYGPGLTPAAFSLDIQTSNDEDYFKQFKAVCRLARMSTVPLLTIAAAPTGSALESETPRLAKLTAHADNEGVLLTLDTRIGTLTEDPDVAVALCQKVPNLGLTLDPSHYLVGPNQGKNYDQVFPFVRHVHLRDTGRGPNQFQVRIGQGEIEYGRIISQLARYGYDRLLCVDVRDVPDSPIAMEPEVRKLKYLLESLI